MKERYGCGVPLAGESTRQSAPPQFLAARCGHRALRKKASTSRRDGHRPVVTKERYGCGVPLAGASTRQSAPPQFLAARCGHRALRKQAGTSRRDGHRPVVTKERCGYCGCIDPYEIASRCHRRRSLEAKKRTGLRPSFRCKGLNYLMLPSSLTVISVSGIAVVSAETVILPLKMSATS